MKFRWQVGILFLHLVVTNQHSIPSSPKYIGAVVEYAPVTDTNDEQKIGTINAKNYLKFIKEAEKYSVDIIVFPESSLSIPSPNKNETVKRSEAASIIPEPSANIIPCNDNGTYAESLRLLSCGARDARMYVVINHREKVKCDREKDAGCPTDGLLIYNSHVTFDREGRVIARYRKYNLFGESGTNVTRKPELSTFTTDFGVTFGQFICFDILFEEPAVKLVRERGVTDIVYSAHWFSELPIGLGLEVQAAWAYATDVNFLAAGHNNPSTGSGGSGIFIGRKGHARAIVERKASNVLIVSEIPKKTNGQRHLQINQEKVHVYAFNKSEISTTEEDGEGDNRFFYRTSNISNYLSDLLELKTGTYESTQCNNQLCCNFTLDVEFDENKDGQGNFYRYRMLVFNGTMSFAGKGSGQVQICSVVACVNHTLAGCGHMFKPGVQVKQPMGLKALNITMLGLKPRNVVFLPITLASNLLPLNVTEFDYRQSEDSSEINLIRPRWDLLTFGIVGRDFGKKNAAMNLPVLSVFTVMIIGSIVSAF